MSEQLPVFEDLTPVEVNDLVATEIMGWVKFEGQMNGKATGRYAWRGPHTIRVRAEFDGPYQQSDIFNPYHDLNDCHLAEERLREGSLSVMMQYAEILDTLNTRCQKGGSYHGGRQFNLIHMDAKTRCHGMLLAKGLVQ